MGEESMEVKCSICEESFVLEDGDGFCLIVPENDEDLEGLDDINMGGVLIAHIKCAVDMGALQKRDKQ